MPISLRAHAFYTTRQPGNFTGTRVFVKDALGGAPHNFRLCFSKRHSRGFLITGCHRFLYFLYKAADAASAPTVDLGLPFGFADTLFRRFNIGHFALKLGLDLACRLSGAGPQGYILVGNPGQPAC